MQWALLECFAVGTDVSLCRLPSSKDHQQILPHVFFFLCSGYNVWLIKNVAATCKKRFLFFFSFLCVVWRRLWQVLSLMMLICISGRFCRGRKWKCDENLAILIDPTRHAPEWSATISITGKRALAQCLAWSNCNKSKHVTKYNVENEKAFLWRPADVNDPLICVTHYIFWDMHS